MKENLPVRLKPGCPAFIARSLLTAYALCVTFHAPLEPSHYETALDYAIASIYELLGTYDLKFLFLLILSAFFYHAWGRHRVQRDRKPDFSLFLAAFFALCLLLGNSYHEVGNSSYCFGNLINFLKSTLAFGGFTLFFHALIGLACKVLDSQDFRNGREHFFTKHAFSKSFFILFGFYMLFLVVAFPGKLCWDAIGQIEQVIGDAAYSTHHPLFHTLIMGGAVRAGEVLFRSPELGLFGYMLLQDAALAAALAATIAVLSRRKARFSLLLCLLLLYCLTPAYSNMASTAVKDVPYAAAVVGYVVCLALLTENPGLLRKHKFTVLFFLVQVSVILSRNNGLYVVLLSGIACLPFFFRKSRSLQERVRCLLATFGGSILTAKLILALLAFLCSAVPGSIGEMLPVPLQQTARYLQLYQDELSPSEQGAIEAVLGDISAIAARYDPASADPVKALFHKEATARQLAGYMKAWGQGFFRHPCVYFDTFFRHIYGWFTPSVSNSIRYEADEYDRIRQGGLFPNAEKLLIFYYRFAGRSLLGFLENIGLCTWALFFLAFYQKRHRRTGALRACIPLWISLLICMAAPCFFGHPRYAYPILFSLPFMYGFTLTLAPSPEESARK